MLDALGQQNSAINTSVQAGNSGWLQNAMGVVNAVSGAAKGAGSMGVGFGTGQTFG
jgi:hypothetical protein